MPDLKAEGLIVFWPNERCASCREETRGKCPLLAALKTLHIVTTVGMTVFQCDGYDPDYDSPLYIDIEDVSPIQAVELDLQAVAHRLELLLGAR